MANQERNVWFSSKSCCKTCRDFIPVDTATYLARNAFLSQFFAINLPSMIELNVEEQLAWCASACYIIKKNDTISLSIYRNASVPNVISLLQTPKIFEYEDHFCGRSRELLFGIPEPQQILHATIITRHVVNIKLFSNLISLKLGIFAPSFIDDVGYLALEDLPITLETLNVNYKHVKGQFNPKIELKHLLITNNRTRPCDDPIILPPVLETVTIDASIEIICNASLRCFGRVFTIDLDPVGKPLVEVNLPSGLEIYVHFQNYSQAENIPFIKSDGVYVLKNFCHYYSNCYYRTLNFVLPSSLRILVLTMTPINEQYLPNLETIYATIHYDFVSNGKFVCAPNLKTMRLVVSPTITDMNPVFELINKNYPKPISHLIIERGEKQTSCPKVNAKNITCISSDFCEPTMFVNHDFSK
jgi:hypothetical protein